VTITADLEVVLEPLVVIAKRLGGFDERILEDVIVNLRALAQGSDDEERMMVDHWLDDQDYIDDLERELEPAGVTLT